MIIGTSGHIDHGKTSLVQAITGVDADRLKEEKARGITIDLGFAYWPQADGGSIGFVDVPGHEGYIHNMLAGINGVNALMLVVAANEGVKPQTREHLLIADLLGLETGIVALTKIDLVDAETLALRVRELRAMLEPTGLRTAPILPVSNVTGQGVNPLKAALQALRPQGLPNDSSRPFRLAVDRVFTLSGAGTVITGSILSGTIRVESRLMASPTGKDVRVRSIHAQNRKVDSAAPGDRAALNLAGVSVNEVSRGDVLMDGTLHRPTQRFDARVMLVGSETKPLASWTPVHLHIGTGVWRARIVPLNVDKLAPGETGLAQIILDRPIAVLGGDRLILRDASARTTIGGGMVLDIRAPERNRRKPERLRWLNALAAQAPSEALPQLLQLAPYAVDIECFARDRGLHDRALDDVIKRENLLILPSGEGRFVFAPALVLKLSRAIRDKLAEHHERQPDQAGLAMERLRLALEKRLMPDAFAALASHLIKRGEIASAGVWLRLPDHVPRLTAQHEALWSAIKPMLSGDARFKPPRVGEIVAHLREREDTVRGLMKRLARRGDIDEIAVDHFLLRPAVGELLRAALATQAATTGGWFNAAAYRDQIGIGRKMAILILEFFDRHGVTIRNGDMRRVDARKAGVFC